MINQRAPVENPTHFRIFDPQLFPTSAVGTTNSGRAVFLFGALSYVIVDSWLFRWVPLGFDNGHFWQLFYTSYTEVFHSHELAHWFPYGAYGQPNDFYNFLGLTSTDYLLMLIGALFRVRNALLLFQLSVIVDHLLFLFGLCLIARTLFKRSSAVWLCVIASLALLHGLQLSFIHVFRIGSWYPLILYALAVFFRDREPRALWAAGLMMTCWSLGAFYLPTFLGLCLAPFVVIAGWTHSDAWQAVWVERRRHWRWFVISVTVAALYLVVGREAQRGLDVIREYRSAVGSVTLPSFLGSRDHTPFEVMLSLFSAGTFYIGLLPLGLLLWGLVAGPSLTFVAFTLSGVVLVWFGLSGLFAKSLYTYVPFIGLTRYLYMGFYLLRVPLILAAAAAWDGFSANARRDRLALLAIPVVAVLALDVAIYAERVVLVGADAQMFAQLWPPTFRRLVVYGACCAGAWLFGLFGRRVLPVSPPIAVAIALLVALFVDTFGYSYRSGSPSNPYRPSFRAALSANWVPSDPADPLYQAGRVQRLLWQPERLDVPRNARAQLIVGFSPAYFHTYGYAQFDPCRSSVVGFTVASSMAALLNARDPNDPAMRTVLGCAAPKLRLLTRAHYVTSQAAAVAALRSSSDLIDTAIIEVPPGAPLLNERPPGAADPAGTFTVTAFDANSLTVRVRVAPPGGAWLVYADAYDPRWHAWVNDASATVLPANVGLKAVGVPLGESTVRLEFHSAGTTASSALALIGAACSICLLVFCGRCAVLGFPQPSRLSTEDC